MVRDLGLKLRLTHLVTGCITQKALHARFRQVNPETGYDPERAYKWVQDRAAPRDRSVYDDLARVLDLPVGGEVVRTCSFDEFRRLVEARHGPVPAVIPGTSAHRPPPEAPAAAPAPDPLAGPPPPAYLVGRYLTFTLPWSAARAGQVAVGGLSVTQGVAQDLVAIYEERLPGAERVLSGPLQRMGRSLTATVRNPVEETFLFMCFRLPPPPAAALAGMLTGAAYYDAECGPATSRTLCLRTALDTRDALLDLTGHREARADTVAAALTGAGIPAAHTQALAARILAFLAGPCRHGVVDVSAAAVNAAVAPLYEPAA